MTLVSTYMGYIVALLFFLLPAISFGAGIEYSDIVESSDAEALVRVRTFTSTEYFRCELISRACSATSQDTSVAPPQSAPAYMAAYRALLPAGSTRLTRSPDGRYIAFYVPGTASRGKRTFGVMDTTSLTMYTKDEALQYWDLLTEGIRVFAFSPDSKTLLYISDAKNHPTLYSVPLKSLSRSALQSTRLFSRDYTVADVMWLDADTLLFIANREGPHQWSLYRYSVQSGTLKKIADNVSYDENLKRIGNLVLLSEVSERGVRPTLYDIESGALTYLNLPARTTEETLGKSVKLAQGLTGVFLLEPSKNSDTLLVWLHGGPYRQASIGYHPYMSYGGYDWTLEKARDADVGVLKLDYPGSFGYGRAFGEALIRKAGVKDVADAHAAIADFAKRNQYSKVYLMGNSYGGYLALRLLVEKPDYYKGAFSINGVADWTTMLTQLDTSIFNVLFKGTVGDANDNYDLYERASIYNRVEKLKGNRIVLMHGEKDLTIPVRQSEGLATFLTQNNKPVEFIKLSGEDHVFKKPESFITLCETTLAFVGKTRGSLCDVGQ